ncbi:hypothetical protein [Photobacterium leiognathi]|uniref:hypothetical protein n=1 Tax=Photobacterium leiognathi TaxID=553611 RepID=UPI0027358CB4|nr:hypothetical protein [Photobacterium leiognathi]
MNSLDLCDLVKDTDHVIDIGLPDGRVNFEILIAPNDFVPEEPHFSVRYEGLLSVIVVLRPEITVPIDLKDAFIVLGPKAGLFEEQQLDNQDALIKFHQKLNSTQDLVLYSPNESWGVQNYYGSKNAMCS